MGRPFGGGQAAIDVAVALVPFLVVVGSALYLYAQHRCHGRLVGWSGWLTLAALATGLGLVAYAVWPLPTSSDGLCPVTFEAASPPQVRSILLSLGAFAPVGLLARARFRRGLPFTLALGVALSLAVAVVRGTGVLGLYPCAYGTEVPELSAVAVVGVLLGWLLARWVPAPWPFGPYRSWPGAVPDRAVPDLLRRALGTLVDLGLWWFGSALVVALLQAYGVIDSPGGRETRTVVLLVLALGFALLTPLLRRDRCTPGGTAVRLALTERCLARPAARPRVLARALLSPVPVAVLIALGSPWWALGVLLAHAAVAVVHPDGTGPVDLLCGTRVRTRATIDGELPGRLVRYSPPREEPTDPGTRRSSSPPEGPHTTSLQCR